MIGLCHTHIPSTLRTNLKIPWYVRKSTSKLNADWSPPPTITYWLKSTQTDITRRPQRRTLLGDDDGTPLQESEFVAAHTLRDVKPDRRGRRSADQFQLRLDVLVDEPNGPLATWRGKARLHRRDVLRENRSGRLALRLCWVISPAESGIPEACPAFPFTPRSV